MLPRTASHTKWICSIILMLSVLIWFGQQHEKVLWFYKFGTAIAASSPEPEPRPKKPAAGADREGTAPEAAPVTASSSTESMKQETRNYKWSPHEGQDLTQYQAIEVTATGYYAGIESTGKQPGHPEYGVTFSGLRVLRDEGAFSTIAADPHVFPIGTVLYIPGYGYGVVADTGGAIKGNRIDLYFDTKDQVYKEWGKKTLHVFVVRQGEGKLSQRVWNQLKSEVLAPS